MSRVLGVGAGNGNLPVAYVNCLVKDLDGEIWAGTNEGVSIFYNPASVMDGGTIADAAQPWSIWVVTTNICSVKRSSTASRWMAPTENG